MTCNLGGYGWELSVAVYFYFDDWFDAYLWLVDNHYWDPYTYCYPVELNHLAQQYENTSWYDPTAFGSIEGPGIMLLADRETAHWKPTCEEFT